MAIGGIGGKHINPEDSRVPGDEGKESIKSTGSHRGRSISKQEKASGGSPLNQARTKRQQDIEPNPKRGIEDLEATQLKSSGSLKTKAKPELTRPESDAPLPPMEEGGTLSIRSRYSEGFNVAGTIARNVVMLAHAKTPEEEGGAKERITQGRDELEGIVQAIGKARSEAPMGSQERAELSLAFTQLSSKLKQVNDLIEDDYDVALSGYDIPRELQVQQEVVGEAKGLLEGMQADFEKATGAAKKSLGGAIRALKDFIQEGLLSFSNSSKITRLMDTLKNLEAVIDAGPFAVARKIDAFIARLSSASQALEAPMVAAVKEKAHAAIGAAEGLSPLIKEAAIQDFNKDFAAKLKPMNALPQEWQAIDMESFAKDWLESKLGIIGEAPQKVDDSFFEDLEKEIDDLPGIDSGAMDALTGASKEAGMEAFSKESNVDVTGEAPQKVDDSFFEDLEKEIDDLPDIGEGLLAQSSDSDKNTVEKPEVEKDTNQAFRRKQASGDKEARTYRTRKK